MDPDDATVAIVIDDGYQTLELWYPLLRLQEAGCTVEIAAPDGVTHESGHGYDADPDLVTGHLSADDYDATVIPGGLHSAQRLRNDEDATAFIAGMDEAGKPIAAIGQAGWILASADILEGREVAATDAVADDMDNAGAEPSDEPVVDDDNLITAQGPDQLPTATAMLVDRIREL